MKPISRNPLCGGLGIVLVFNVKKNGFTENNLQKDGNERKWLGQTT